MWVVETKRGRQFSRTDRYEISKDGRTLRYTTYANEDGMGRVTDRASLPDSRSRHSLRDQPARSAVATGMRAARSAGSEPPMKADGECPSRRNRGAHAG